MSSHDATSSACLPRDRRDSSAGQPWSADHERIPSLPAGGRDPRRLDVGARLRARDRADSPCRAPTSARPADGPGREVNRHNESKPFCPSLVDGQGERVRSRGTGGAAEASFAETAPQRLPRTPPLSHNPPRSHRPARPGSQSPSLAVRGLAAGSVQADPATARDYADAPLVVQVTPERLSATVLTGGTTLWLLQSGFWTYLLILGLPLWRHVDLLPIVDSAGSDERASCRRRRGGSRRRTGRRPCARRRRARAACRCGGATLMRIRPTVQMSFGLALLTSAVLLVVDLLFGVFTDPDVQLMRLRKALAESTATQVAVLLERGDHKTLGLTLARIREQDPSIRSLAVRRADRDPGCAIRQPQADLEASWRGIARRSPSCSSRSASAASAGAASRWPTTRTNAARCSGPSVIRSGSRCSASRCWERSSTGSTSAAPWCIWIPRRSSRSASGWPSTS